jgi:D-apiose dehydrogenase
VNSIGLNPVIAGEDAALVQLVFADGALGTVDANRIAGNDPPEVAYGTLTLEGQRGALQVAADGQISLTEYGRGPRQHVYDIPTNGYRGDSVFALQSHLVSALKYGTVAESEGADYLKTTAAVFACYESAASGLPYSPNELLRDLPL